jgi:transposase
MEIQALLPDSGSLSCDRVVRHGNQVVVAVSGVRSLAACPACGRSSDRVHSHYVRRLADLPWQGLRVEVQWRCRRFFCINPHCRQQIFSERLPEVAEPYARKTHRLTAILRAIAFVCGGEEGARLLDRLAIPASPDTLLREIRRTPDDNCPTVKVVGVDDWALRRGQRYGTILVDLERHCPVDLLPERSAKAVAVWLRSHPEVEVVSRDRGDCYIKGAEQGAPQATQVTDRWHLLHNMQEALVQLVDRHRKQLKGVAKSVREVFSAQSPTEIPSTAVAKSPTKAEQARAQRRQRRLERYQQVVELHAQGVAIREIARRLHMQRRTVRLWMERESLPERAVPPPHRGVDIWTEYLQHRWQVGYHNAAALTAELKARGYKGSYDMVRRCVAAWRQPRSCLERRTPLWHPLHCDSPRSIAWALIKSSDEEEAEQQKLAKLFRDACPDVNQAVQLALQFRRLVTERRVDDLDDWIARSVAADAPAEIRRFAAGLKPDLMAVKAALSLP